MEDKKTEVVEKLEQVVGGTDTTTSTGTTTSTDTTSSNPFANFPRVTDHQYTTDVTNRA